MKKNLVVLLLITVMSIVSLASVKYGGEAIVGLTTIQVQNNFNPFSPNCEYFVKNGVIFEPLWYINTMNGKEQPWLAKSYEWKNNNKKLIFHLKDNLRWSDGSSLTAYDVAFTFNLMKKYPALDLNGIWNGSIFEIKATDEKTIDFVYSKIDVPSFLNICQVPVIPEKYWEDVEDPVTFLNPKAVGSGPFIVSRVDEAAQVIAFKKNMNYWNPGKPYIDGVKLKVYQSNDANNLALIKGEIDWADTMIPDIKKTYADRVPGINIYWVASTSPVFMLMNLTKTPFNDKNFRKAVSMAINKDKIARVGEYGYTPAAHPTGMQVGFLDEWFDKSLDNLVYGYDVSGAKELLKESGYMLNGNGKLIDPKTNKPISFDLTVVTGWTDWITSAQLISSDLKKLGIGVNVIPVSYGQYNQTIYTGMFDTAIGAPDQSGSNPYYAYNRMMNSSLTAAIGDKAISNYIRWSNGDTDNALNIFKETSDFSIQKKCMTIIAKQMLTEVPAIPLFYTPVCEGYSARRLIGWPSEDNQYCSAEPWAMLTPGLIMQNVHLK